jgi:hypothetical protein
MKITSTSPSQATVLSAEQDSALAARQDRLSTSRNGGTASVPRSVDNRGGTLTPLVRPPRRLSPTLQNQAAEGARHHQPHERAQQSLQMVSIVNDFVGATTEAAAHSAALRAVAFYTKNSTLINAPLREGQSSQLLDAFRRAMNHGLKSLPAYGQDSESLDRRVHFSRAMLDEIVKSGQLTDPGFISTTAQPIDPATVSSRNTLIHLRARYSADVSGVSPDPHAREHLLLSNSTLKLENAHIRPIDDEDDPLYGSTDAVRAELWMRQKTPDSL